MSLARKRGWHRMLVGASLVFLIVVPAILSFFWVPFDVTLVTISERLQPPGGRYLLGSDHLGRDVLSLLMTGGRTTLAVAVLAVAMGMACGVPVGLLAAARRGSWCDRLIVHTQDLIFAFPPIVLAVLITAVLGPSASKAMMAIGIFNIPVFARLTRSAASPLWACEFILAARVAGKSGFRISLEHILPNVSHQLLIQGTTQYSLAILAETGLAYIGLSAQPPQPSWGRMLADGQTLFALAPWQVVYPGLAIVVTVLGVNLLGEGLRDFFAVGGDGG